MALKLTIAEDMEFERRAGRPFRAVAKTFNVALCRAHRLMFGACEACRLSARPWCDEHQGDFVSCQECEGIQATAGTVAALGFVLRRRREPELDWEEYIATASQDDVFAEVAAMDEGGNG